MGCEACRRTGYRGRIGIFEALDIDPTLAELIIKGATALDIKSAAAKSGMETIYSDAIRKVREGLTTPEEVLRVILLEEESLFHCPGCSKVIEPDFSICPFCRYELKIQCPGCGQELSADWTHCPHCRTTVSSEPAPLQAPEPPEEAATLEIPEDKEQDPIIIRPAKSAGAGSQAGAEARRPTPTPPAVKAQPAAPVPAPDAGGPASVLETPPAGMAGAKPIGDLPGGLESILVPDKRFRILIADDDIVTCNLITLLLRRFKIKTTAAIATDGVEALEQVKKSPPHLIVLDLLMPEMDGYEFLAKLRSDLTTAFIPVLVITQTQRDDTEKLAKDYGADAYLNKPLNPQDLEKTITGLLNRIYGI